LGAQRQDQSAVEQDIDASEAWVDLGPTIGIGIFLALAQGRKMRRKLDADNVLNGLGSILRS
jgi:hypothetical protein